MRMCLSVSLNENCISASVGVYRERSGLDVPTPFPPVESYTMGKASVQVAAAAAQSPFTLGPLL